MADSKYDSLMTDVTNGVLKDKVDELINRMGEVLEDEGLGTMDDMMEELGKYLHSKNKLEEYVDESGVMKIPLETVFSWFKTSIEKKKEGLR